MSLTRWQAYARIMRMDKPIGTLLLLWPTLWALWLAQSGFPGYSLLGIFVVGVFLTRSAGCVLNDIADRRFDGAVARTQSRPLVQGALSVKEAYALVAVLFGLAFALVLQLNTAAIKLSFLAVIMAAAYPYMKRFTHLPQLWLGATFSLGVPMAFFASGLVGGWSCWILYALTFLWIVAFDGMYAMVDRQDDLNIGVRSIAIFLGAHEVWIFIALQCVFAIGLLSYLWFIFQGGYVLSGLALVLGMLIYRQYRLIATRLPAACFKAFIANHWIGLWVFVAICWLTGPWSG